MLNLRLKTLTSASNPSRQLGLFFDHVKQAYTTAEFWKLNSQLNEAELEQFLSYWRELAVYGEETTPSVAHGEVADSDEPAATVIEDSEPTTLKLIETGTQNDYSFVLLANGEPLMGCRLTLYEQGSGKTTLGCGDESATTYLNSKILDLNSHNVSALAAEKIASHLNSLIEKLKPDVIEFKDSLNFGLLSPVTQSLIVRGGAPVVSYSSVIDLRQPYRALLRGVTPSVRCYIQQSQQQYDFVIKPMECRSLNVSQATTAGTIGHKFHVSVIKNGEAIATAEFSFRQSRWRLGEIEVQQKDLVNKAILYSLMWAAINHLHNEGGGQVILDHDLQCICDHELSFTQLGGKLKSEMTVTLFIN